MKAAIIQSSRVIDRAESYRNRNTETDIHVVEYQIRDFTILFPKSSIRHREK